MARYSVKLLLAGILAFAGIVPAQAQNAYPLFAPANGVLVGDENTYITTAADATDIIALWSACNNTVFLRGDGTCSLIDLASNVTGTLPAANGGTGVTSLGTLTKVDDTNVTLTLGGTPTGSLINNVSVTAGWSGLLAASRGGLGISTVTDDTTIIANGSGWVSSSLPNCLDTSGNHLNYNPTTNSIFCGTSSSVSPVSPANPTGVIGLTAVNGVSPNFIRSDGAPALSQAIAPTWSAQHLFSSSGIGASTAARTQSDSPWYGWRETDQAANNQDWLMGASGAHLLLYSSVDGSALDRAILDVGRSGVALTALQFGNATDNPTYSWLGTGTSIFGGSGQFNGDHVGIASTDSFYEMRETDQGADGKVWWTRGVSGNYAIQTRTDGLAAGQDAFVASRSGTAITSLNFGNTSGNPTYTFNGTGAFTVNSATSTFFGQARLDNGATSNVALINSTNANGPYVTFQRSGVAFADMGSARNCGGGGTIDGLGFCARSGNPLELFAGGRTSPDLALTSAGEIQTRQVLRLGTGGTGGSAPLRIVAADSLGDNYIQAYSNDGTTSRWYLGNGGSASNDVQFSNDTVGADMQFYVDGQIAVNVTSSDTVAIGRDNNAAGATLAIGRAAASCNGAANIGLACINGVTRSRVELRVNGTDTGLLDATSSSIQLGTTPSIPLTFYTNNTTRSTLAADGGWVQGSATGGSQGAGTINATGLYINGVPVSGGGTTTGSFTGTLTGMSGSVTGTVQYTKSGGVCALYLTSPITGTSNALTMTLTGLPATVESVAGSQPSSLGYGGIDVSNAIVTISSVIGNTVSFSPLSGAVAGNWTSSGTKGLAVSWSVVYNCVP